LFMMASAMIERAEFPVQRNNTLYRVNISISATSLGQFHYHFSV
jgi:hypothetical protein